MTIKFNRLACAIALGFGIAAAPAAFAATVLKGTVGERINDSFAASFTNVTYVSGGTGSFEQAATLVCIDMENKFPTAGSIHTYTLSSTGLATVSNAAASSRATDLFNYAVDKYYNSMVLNQSGNGTGYQFSALMWEIGSDFNGTATSLNATTGGMKASMITSVVNPPAAYEAMVSDLSTNYATIAQGYRSTRYTVSFLDDKASGYQSMMMLTPLAAVPEPSTLAFSLLGGLALFGWKQRRSAKPR